MEDTKEVEESRIGKKRGESDRRGEREKERKSEGEESRLSEGDGR